jgi:hypothetical protein
MGDDEELQALILRTTKSHLRYFDFCGNVLDAWGKTGEQQGDQGKQAHPVLKSQE